MNKLLSYNLEISKTFKDKITTYLSSPSDFGAREEIKNMKADSFLIVLKGLLSSQASTYEFERQDFIAELLPVINSITELNAEVKAINDQIHAEISSFNENPSEYQISVQKDIGVLKNGTNLVAIWTYILIAISGYVQSGELIRKRFNATLKCGFIRFFELIVNEDDKNQSDRLMNVFDATVSNLLSPICRDIPISSTSDVEYNLEDFIRTQQPVHEYGDISQLRFYFRKMNVNTDANHAIICISGFTSEETDMKEQWMNVIKYVNNPEVFTLDWKSIKSPSFWNIFSTGLKIWECKENAIKTGKALAKILTDNFIFKNKSISLLGFSMGTEVIVNCLDELKRLGAYGVIQNIYLLGGAAIDEPADVWNQRLKVVSGRIVNVNCKTDCALIL